MFKFSHEQITQMGRKLCLSSFLDRMAPRSGSPPPPPPWRWPPSCKRPRTHSFREEEEDVTGGVSSYLERSNYSDTSFADDCSVEKAIFGGLRSEDRLLFEPAGCTRSLVAASAGGAAVPLFRGSVAVVVDSSDPYSDFKASMVETVMAHGARDWEWLQEMLLWYLRANEKRNHGVIVVAFVDLVVSLASSTPSSSSTAQSYSSFFSASSFSSSSVSCEI